MKEVLYEKEHKKLVSVLLASQWQPACWQDAVPAAEGKHGRQRSSSAASGTSGDNLVQRHFEHVDPDDVSDRRPYPDFDEVTPKINEILES